MNLNPFKQAQAEARELAKLQQDVAILENLLHLPASNLDNFKALRSRLENLRRVNARRIEPDNDWSSNRFPINLNDYPRK